MNDTEQSTSAISDANRDNRTEAATGCNNIAFLTVRGEIPRTITARPQPYLEQTK